eukprot:TRINITY_DN2355_c0_g1_i2.p1 TRINITY_DN2355_c0_g1~~TRINITY_DN2355_c0_g1_i2.p1  ORF type:complete len:129 (+),score=34.95 TRINITY_DN2355_c0_g1_i2:182-568(+)
MFKFLKADKEKQEKPINDLLESTQSLGIRGEGEKIESTGGMGFRFTMPSLDDEKEKEGGESVVGEGDEERIKSLGYQKVETESVEEEVAEPLISSIPESYQENNTRKMMYTVKSLKRDDWIRERRRRQ